MTRRHESHMTQADLFSRNMEQDPILRSTIIAVIVLDTEPDWDRLVRMIDRGTRVVPKFRQKLVTAPFGLAPPRWVADPDFDLSWHLRHVSMPAPADLGVVLDFARTAGMDAFDDARPLWEFTLLSGLDNGRTALVTKVHHALTDGIGGVQIASEIVDFVRAGTDRGALPAPPDSGSTPSSMSTLADTIAWNWSTGLNLARAGASTLLSVAGRTVRNPIGAVREAAVAAGSVVRFARPIADTLSPVMTRRSLGRHFAVLDVPVNALQHAANDAGSTINNAFLASVLIGLRSYHESHHATVKELRVTVPISLRTESDPIGGNRITLARFGLPLDVADTSELIRRVGAVVEGWRHEPAVPLSSAIAGVLNLVPVSYLTEMLKHVDFVASNVPGSPVPLYLAGAEIERYYAFGPTLGTAFNVTLMSHTDTCCIGINADTAAIPDLPVMTECIAAGFRTVLGLSADRSIDTTVDIPWLGTTTS